MLCTIHSAPSAAVCLACLVELNRMCVVTRCDHAISSHSLFHGVPKLTWVCHKTLRFVAYWICFCWLYGYPRMRWDDNFCHVLGTKSVTRITFETSTQTYGSGMAKILPYCCLQSNWVLLVWDSPDKLHSQPEARMFCRSFRPHVISSPGRVASSQAFTLSRFRENVSKRSTLSSGRLSQVQIRERFSPGEKVRRSAGVGMGVGSSALLYWELPGAHSAESLASLSPRRQPTWLVYRLSCPLLPRPRTQIRGSQVWIWQDYGLRWLCVTVERSRQGIARRPQLAWFLWCQWWNTDKDAIWFLLSLQQRHFKWCERFPYIYLIVVHRIKMYSFYRFRESKTPTVNYTFNSMPRLNLSGVPDWSDESAFPGYYVLQLSTKTGGGASEFSTAFWWPARKANIHVGFPLC